MDIVQSILDHVIVHLSECFVKHKKIIHIITKIIPNYITVNSQELSKDVIFMKVYCQVFKYSLKKSLCANQNGYNIRKLV